MTNLAILFQSRQQWKFSRQQIFNRARANQPQRFLLAQRKKSGDVIHFAIGQNHGLDRAAAQFFSAR